MFKVQGSKFKVRSPEFTNLEPGTWNSELGNARQRARGFTIFELVVAIVIFSVLITVLLGRFGFYQEMAERAAMESTLRLIKTGLQIHLAELIVANRQGEAVKLEAEDPMQWLDPKPANYAGTFREPPERGAWYFDAGEKQLVYVVNTGKRLELDAAGSDGKQLRFRAQLLKDRIQAGGATIESVTGVTVVPVHAYRWSRARPGAILA
jgi:prepilin-type N-terminal cleavage/methylation domain-containing protein